jgi:hypothetical protein
MSKSAVSVIARPIGGRTISRLLTLGALVFAGWAIGLMHLGGNEALADIRPVQASQVTRLVPVAEGVLGQALGVLAERAGRVTPHVDLRSVDDLGSGNTLTGGKPLVQMLRLPAARDTTNTVVRSVAVLPSRLHILGTAEGMLSRAVRTAGDPAALTTRVLTRQPASAGRTTSSGVLTVPTPGLRLQILPHAGAAQAHWPVTVHVATLRAGHRSAARHVPPRRPRRAPMSWPERDPSSTLPSQTNTFGGAGGIGGFGGGGQHLMGARRFLMAAPVFPARFPAVRSSVDDRSFSPD